MQKEENYKNDLDYLSERGFEEVAVNSADIKELRKKFRAKKSSGSFYYSLGFLVLGIGMGAALFFGLSKKDHEGVPKGKAGRVTEPVVKQFSSEKIISLDTISIVGENFINPAPKHNPISVHEKTESPSENNSADVIVTKPLDVSILSKGPVKEEKLKYMVNSPVFYIHDMKISNYTTLYFKKNHFVKFTGLSAAYSTSTESQPAGSRLKESADYYLHEELASAMLMFKKGRYDEAIYSLKTVSSYNKEDLNCQFYLAMCYYYKKNYTAAIGLFDECIANTNNAFLQEAGFYKALSLYESGNKEASRNLFKKIADEEEFYSQKARSYLKE